ncbi:MAG: hypothetical protein ACXVRY_13455 [Gaiellaceae bacterium]
MVAGKRILLLAIVGSLCITAALAITILLFSKFGETQGRILGTTGLIALYGLLALPAGILFDQGRRPGLARGVIVLTAVGFVVAMGELWTSSPPDQLGKMLASVTAFALASSQTAALAARRSSRDPATVRRLFAASLALAAGLASMVTVAAWAEVGHQMYYRVLAALVVADVLAAALQPILARLGAEQPPVIHRLRLYVQGGAELELTVEAPSFATAVGKAIATAEQKGGRVVRIERVDQAPGGVAVVSERKRHSVREAPA